MRTHRGHRKDANHDTIAQAFRDHGASVVDTHALGDGFGDLLIGYRRHTAIIEIKYGNGKPTDDEIDFAQNWRGGDYFIVRSAVEVDSICAEYDRQIVLEELPF